MQLDTLAIKFFFDQELVWGTLVRRRVLLLVVHRDVGAVLTQNLHDVGEIACVAIAEHGSELVSGRDELVLHTRRVAGVRPAQRRIERFTLTSLGSENAGFQSCQHTRRMSEQVLKRSMASSCMAWSTVRSDMPILRSAKRVSRARDC